MSADPIVILAERLKAAIAMAAPELPLGAIDPMVAASKNPKFGDYQCNAAMSVGKLVGKAPREVAVAIVKNLRIDDLAEPVTEKSIAGPGFINITLKPAALNALLEKFDSGGLGFDAPTLAAERVVVDLCGVNLAKEMHIGHLRSTVIGDALARILAKTGAEVIRQNHVGDWGLPIAMVTARLMAGAAAGTVDLGALTLSDLDTHYRAARRDADADVRGLAAAVKWHMGPKVLAELEAQTSGALAHDAAAKDVLRRLQNQDPAVVAVWQRISDVTMAACLEVCRRLNSIVLPEHSAGESSYAGELAGIVETLVRMGVAEESEGALIVRLDDVGVPEPLLIRKRDGAFLYATTDLAAVRRRVQELGATRVVYCVDARQSLHFRQFFGAAHKAGFTRIPSDANGAVALLEHAAFGTILGDDGTPFKTRSGASVRLADVIDEATRAAAEIVAEKNADLSADERARIAEVVAIAALRYVDLSTERIRDYVFSLSRMLSFEGNTGPYLLYALVRIRSIFRKARERGFDVDAGAAQDGVGPLAIQHPAEKALALVLLRYPAAVQEAARALEPSRLCAYVYELAGAFSSFFDACPVLTAPDQPTRAARLRLCAIAQRVLAEGLTLLGIPTLERM
ncbi:arginine--tRNA ligase [soil metagenome]